MIKKQSDIDAIKQKRVCQNLAAIIQRDDWTYCETRAGEYFCIPWEDGVKLWHELQALGYVDKKLDE